MKGQPTNAARASHPSRIVIADILTAVFRQGERSSRNCTPKSAMQRCSPEACASGLRFSASILLGRRISEEAAKPGHRHTGHAPNSPDDSLSRSHRQTLNPLSEQIQNISRFDCKHFAAAGRLTQPQTAAPLCKNCGAKKLPVERKGKVYFYFARSLKTCGLRPLDSRGRLSLRGMWRALPYNTSDDCASSRNFAGETSEPGDRGNSRGRL